jgi:hypothetical protein
MLIILIVLIVFIVFYNKQSNTEKFENEIDNKEGAEMIFFLSDNCGHCVRYKKNYDNAFKDKLKSHINNITFKIAEPEEFSTYGVQSVPKALIRNTKNTHYKLIDGLGGMDESNLQDKVRQVCDAWKEIQKNSLK